MPLLRAVSTLGQKIWWSDHGALMSSQAVDSEWSDRQLLGSSHSESLEKEA